MTVLRKRKKRNDIDLKIGTLSRGRNRSASMYLVDFPQDGNSRQLNGERVICLSNGAAADGHLNTKQ